MNNGQKYFHVFFCFQATDKQGMRFEQFVGNKVNLETERNVLTALNENVVTSGTTFTDLVNSKGSDVTCAKILLVEYRSELR